MRQGILRELLRRPLGLGAFLVLVLLYACAIFAPFLATYQVSDQSLDHSFHPPSRLLWKDGALHAQLYVNVDPSAARWEPLAGETVRIRLFAPGYRYDVLFGLTSWDRHLLVPDESRPDAQVYLLGSDATGRDVFSRLLYGARVSLSIGLIGITITMVMGFLVGGLAGYFGGRVDFLAMRGVEFLMAIPGLYLLLALRSTLAPHFESGQMFLLIVIILAFIGWAGTARVIRGLSLSIRGREFVLAAEAMGQSTFNILVKHILPNLTSYLLVAATLSIPAYILGEAALSFLGLGIQEPSASWGLMLSQAQNDMKVFMLNFWWLLTPGAAIFVTVIAFNVFGDALRDIVDPRMKV
jgi:peptide/nickel transport system permease protein